MTTLTTPCCPPVSLRRKSTTGPAASRVPVYFSYNARGQRTQMRDASGLTRYFYDDFNRLKIKATPQGTLTYNHNLNGNLTALDTTRTYQFDAAGRITGENPPRQGGVNLIYDWDPLSRLSDVVNFSGGTEASYAYEVNELKTVEYPYPNGIRATYQYNPRRQLAQMTIEKVVSGQPNEPRASFNYDNFTDPNERLTPTGIRRRVDEQIEYSGFARTVNFAYDGLNRLKQETIAPGTTVYGTITYDTAPGHSETDGSGLDAVGNRRSRSVSTTILQEAGVSSLSGQTFDANDRLQPATDFDANGNTLFGDVSPALPQSAPDEYDYENHLIKRTTSEKVIELVYDGDGNRVKKTVTEGATKTTTLFLVDDQNPTAYAQVIEELVSENDEPATLVRTYTYGLDLISRREADESRYFYSHDGHGSVRFQTDVNGTITRRYAYDAFGVLLQGSGYADPDLYLYAGEQYDRDLGLYYNRARYYNPNTGRFWTVDTFVGSQSDPLSLHRYLYTDADPVNQIDPSGRESLPSLLTGFTIKAIGFRMLMGSAVGVWDANFRGYSQWEGLTYGAVGGAFGPLIPWQLGITLTAYNVAEALEEGDYDAALFRGAVAVVGAGTFRWSSKLPGFKGGRLGNLNTQTQNTRLALYLQARGWKIRNGGGRGSEERIPGPGGGTQGETWVDLTAEKTIGTTLKTLRIQTVSILKNGAPTPNELNAAARIRNAFPNDKLLLVPKSDQHAIPSLPLFRGADDEDQQNEQ